ncbi:MAG TPA: undecaprenyl-diphosphate phosphatase [Gemmatimonadales bacterium]|jgi:undecaprenyl-diphosphatase|nr:undecaprenyl-diphosphate phosphatase [Gemmatimonadales bacterium]
MTLWQGILLGLVQGITEFLPVSSSGHLVLVEALTGVHFTDVTVEVSLHVATLGSVLVVYGRRLWEITRGVLRGDGASTRYAAMLAIATIPAAAVGVLFHRQIEERFHSLVWLGVQFLITGAILWATRGPQGDRTVPGPAAATGIGFAQAFAILPAISRSGATVAAALWSGLTPAAAAEFSFLLAVPVIAGAAVLEGRRAVLNVTQIGAVPWAVSFVVAFIAGVWSIRFLIALLRRGRFYAFAPYCWAVGALTLAYALWRG